MNYRTSSRKKYLNYFSDESGGIAIISALVLTTLCIAAGAAVEVARIAHYKSQLQHAADAAVLASISQSSKAYRRFSGGGVDEVSFAELGRKDVASFFIQNVQADHALSVIDENINAEVGSENSVLFSKITYTAKIHATFARIIGYENFSVQGHAEARRELNKVESENPALDIHFFLDNSPSMGIGAREEDIAWLQKLPIKDEQGCAFACHIGAEKMNNWYPRDIPIFRQQGLERFPIIVDRIRKMRSSFALPADQ
ncbi:pilus assembly protein TadG-related protein [Ochrobactrum sp. Marseille-Q0166]|uniref:TadE/TadG family type IV pilus assembly protein n=1 Tax=Ochrobactrum sp. Marseille-Q0166 TaxID=2761105 RepID=UPI0016559821|nr:pilus assembly protein TadG-related protein [Ochrobactrum sp. Marseille-Q0166]MBC8719088.1 hypothetical protein [Ochrobactrum sp. Marseille-Q0166]